jgi:acyl-CoA synthetase (AMP-forming)/AMP-acid ligase II
VLARAGLAAGERAALLLPDGLDFVRAFFAAQRLGAVPVALGSGLSADKAARRIETVRPRVVVLDEAAAALPASLPALVSGVEIGAARRGALGTAPIPLVEGRPDDLSHLQLTSGTTGQPRAAMLTHANVMAYLNASLEQCHMRADDTLVGSVPLQHPQGLLRFVLGSPFYGSTTHLVRLTLSTIRLWFETIARVRGTVTSAPDFAWRAAARLVDPRGLDLSCLRIGTSGGEVVRLSTIEAFERRFGRPGVLRPGYGLAEATLAIAAVRPGEALRIGLDGAVSCGQALPGIEMRIGDARGEPVAPGEEGEIAVRGAQVFAGYFDDAEGTRAVLREGWLRTGDIGSVDAEGHLYVRSRVRALIKRGGATVAPQEIEGPVDLLPGVLRSAALGVRNREGRERVALVVEVEPPHRPGSLDALARAASAAALGAVGFAPDDLLLVAPGSLPLTASGKVRYVELGSMLMNGSLRPQGLLWPSS